MKMIWRREETKPEEKRKRREMIWRREETKPEEKRRRGR